MTLSHHTTRERGDDAALTRLECAGMYTTAGREVVAEAFRAESEGPVQYLLGSEYGHGR